MMSAQVESANDLPQLHSPARLTCLAARCLVLNPSVIGFRAIPGGGSASEPAAQKRWFLSRYVFLPEEAADLLLSACRTMVASSSPCLQLLATGRRSHLRCCDVRGLPLDGDQLLALMAFRPRILRLDTHVSFYCEEQLIELRRHTSRLRQLWIGNRAVADTVFLHAGSESVWQQFEEDHTAPQQPSPLPCPRLLSLVLHGSPLVGLHTPVGYVSALVRGMLRLTHLEISNVYREMDVSFVGQLRQLRVLVLHNVCLSSLQPLWQCSQLRYLDISVPGGRQPRSWPDPDVQLASLVQNLPLLEHLDIACTNLAGSGIHSGASAVDESPHQVTPPCDIIGLAARVHRPLKYLNIYGCNASHRLHIPAEEVGGEISELQVLAACAPHTHHPLMMLELFDQMEALLQMNQQVHMWRRMLHLALDAAAEFDYLKDIHIRCAAVIQNVVSSRTILAQLTEIERQRVLSQVFRSVCLQRRSVRLRHFVVLILMNFEVPQDMLFNFSGYVDSLYYMLSGVLGERENFVERVLIFLLNKTCCDVDGTRKELIGRRGLIKVLLRAIQSRCAERNCDEVMRFLWSCLWNVTDETAYNCQMFLDNRGLRLFCECLRNFRTDHSDLVRNMMGLMGNIAEVSQLRAGFLTAACMETFCTMLDHSSTADLEVSYHAGGVLANLLSDGDHTWTLQSPSRQEAIEKLEQAVCQWNVFAERAINYRSLKPIIRLLDCQQRASMLWAVWAVTNLSRTLPDRYAVMVCDEGGLQPLQNILALTPPHTDDKGVHEYLIRLASMCLQNIHLITAE